MAKLMVIPNSKNIKNMINYVDAFLVGIDGLSVNVNVFYNFDELRKLSEILKSDGKELFVALNKNMHNYDLEYLKKALIFIDSLDVKGIFYYDLAVLNIHKKLKLKTDLVWSQEHMTTNFSTCNFYANNGVKYVYLSAEITLEEIKNIEKNTSLSIIVPIFGYLPMFCSKRPLLDNYKEYFRINDKSNFYYLEKEGNRYPIISDSNGTVVYSSYILDGLEEMKELDVSYVTLNQFMIEESIFLEVLKNLKSNVKQKYTLNTKKGFLYNETIYKVKKNEK